MKHKEYKISLVNKELKCSKCKCPFTRLTPVNRNPKGVVCFPCKREGQRAAANLRNQQKRSATRRKKQVKKLSTI